MDLKKASLGIIFSAAVVGGTALTIGGGLNNITANKAKEKGQISSVQAEDKGKSSRRMVVAGIALLAMTGATASLMRDRSYNKRLKSVQKTNAPSA